MLLFSNLCDYKNNSGVSSWGGVEIESTGGLSASDSVYIENTPTGIYTSSSSAIDFYNTVISGFSENGIYVNNSSPEILNVKFLKTGASANCAVYVSGASANPTLNKVTIHDSNYGVYLGTSADATVVYSNFDDTIYNSMIQMSSGSTLDIEERHNNFYHDATYTGGGTKYAIYNLTSVTTAANQNYWGGKDPYNNPSDKTALFLYPNYISLGSRSLSPYSNGAPKIAEEIVYKNPFINAQEIEAREDANFRAKHPEDWSESIAAYKAILSNYNDPGYRRKAIKSLISAYQKSNRDFSEIRDIIDTELKSYTTYSLPWYRESMDFLYAETYVREKEYNRAISEFESRIENNTGSPIEVEMLARIADIYGVMLNDKATAKSYADMAAAKNPGQSILYAAYRSAGVDYDPSLYTDVFAEKTTSDESKGSEALETLSGGSITVSPNPANPSTMLNFTINTASRVKLTVYAVNGQKVATLVDGQLSAGAHSVRFDGAHLGSGLYFYKLESAKFNKTGKIMLLK